MTRRTSGRAPGTERRRRASTDAVDSPDEDLTGVGRLGGLGLLGLVAVVAGAVPFLALLALVEARWPPLHDLDLAVAQGLNDIFAERPFAVRVLEILTEVGGGATAGYVMATAVVWLIIRHRRRLAAYVAVTGIGLAVLVPVTKAIVGRTRPDVALPVVDLPTNASFPSGHAMTSLVAWGALALIALPAVRPAARKFLVIATAALVLLTGFTRLALGVHFVTDVLAGWALGAAWLAVTVLAFRHWLRDRHDRVVPAGLGEEPDRGMRLRTIDESTVPDGRGAALRIALAAVVTCLVVVAMGLLVTGPLAQTPVGRFDSWAVDQAVGMRQPWLTGAVETIGRLGGLWGVVAATVGVAALSLAYRGSWRPVLLTVLAVAGEVVLYGATSQLVGRARPDFRDLTAGLPTGASFPSGHVAAFTAVYGALCLIVLTYGRSRWRWLVVSVVLLLLVVTMFSRVYLAAHYPTDTVGGLLLSAMWLAGLHRYLLAPGTRDTWWWTWRTGPPLRSGQSVPAGAPRPSRG